MSQRKRCSAKTFLLDQTFSQDVCMCRVVVGKLEAELLLLLVLWLCLKPCLAQFIFTKLYYNTLYSHLQLPILLVVPRLRGIVDFTVLTLFRHKSLCLLQYQFLLFLLFCCFSVI